MTKRTPKSDKPEEDQPKSDIHDSKSNESEGNSKPSPPSLTNIISIPLAVIVAISQLIIEKTNQMRDDRHAVTDTILRTFVIMIATMIVLTCVVAMIITIIAVLRQTGNIPAVIMSTPRVMSPLLSNFINQIK